MPRRRRGACACPSPTGTHAVRGFLLGAAASRRSRTAAASLSRSEAVVPQSRQGVVTLMPNAGVIPFLSSCEPESRKESSITPQTCVDPLAMRPATSAADCACASGSARPLAEPQSMTTRGGSSSFCSVSQTACSSASPVAGSTAWQSRLPVVSTMPATPCFETERKVCGAALARTASAAMLKLACAAWKPTGVERPLASSRCSLLSAVRSLIALQLTRSAMNCGEIVSR
mmetsp:Transcript_15597/g.33034  ORF Transcript_15597/g.33034 Transcript_15597/m.33034 type:complete len:230 (+) Transcript_15597:255-944(+)